MIETIPQKTADPATCPDYPKCRHCQYQTGCDSIQAVTVRSEEQAEQPPVTKVFSTPPIYR